MISRDDVILQLMHVYNEVHPNEPIDVPLLEDMADTVMGLIQKALATQDDDD